MTDDLLAAQKRLLDGPLVIVDAGAQDGVTTREYLDAFPECRVIALEPASANQALALSALAPFGKRVELLPVALSDTDGHASLRLTSHYGSHSLLELAGDRRYFAGPITDLPPERVETVTLDRLCAERGITTLDILKMDIQGGELMALRGARSMLSRGAVRLIALEVLFKPLYRDQPMFWDLAEYLRGHGYALQGIYAPHLHEKNAAVLSWADAIFVAPSMQFIPQIE